MGALPPRGRPIYSPQGESPPPRGEIVRLPQGESRRTAHTKRRCREKKTTVLPTGKSSHSECYHHTPHHGEASYSPTRSRSGTLTYKGFVIRKPSYSPPGESLPLGGDHHIPHRGSRSPLGEIIIFTPHRGMGSLPTGGDYHTPHKGGAFHHRGSPPPPGETIDSPTGSLFPTG